MSVVILEKGRERSLRRRHPWVLSGSVAEVRSDAGPGDRVRVVSAEGETLGHGHYSPASRIRVRMLHFGKEEPRGDWLEVRIAAALARRGADPLLADTDALRLVNAEGDGLPGLVVDRYADQLVVRLGSAGMERLRDRIAHALREATGASAAFERADGHAARQEGFPARQGALFGPAPAGPVAIHERGRRYDVDVVEGQKTGFYLDQRDARDRVERLSAGRRVLDLFCYTGGFALAAARGGAASVLGIDSSQSALAGARSHLEREGAPCEVRFERADAFRALRGADEGFDLLVVDPPPLARRPGDASRASRAQKDLLLHAFARAAPDAQWLVFSCSHHLGPDLLRKIAFGASRDAGRPVRVLAELGAPTDHPVSLDHPEGRYLSGLHLGDASEPGIREAAP